MLEAPNRAWSAGEHVRDSSLEPHSPIYWGESQNVPLRTRGLANAPTSGRGLTRLGGGRLQGREDEPEGQAVSLEWAGFRALYLTYTWGSCFWLKPGMVSSILSE